MEAYEKNFQEFRVLKQRARGVGVPIALLIRFKERVFRNHLLALHGNGSPLSELTEYVLAFYGVEVTPQQLRKILQRIEREAWTAAADNYRKHRNKPGHLPPAKGA